MITESIGKEKAMASTVPAPQFLFLSINEMCNTAERNIMVDVRGRAQLCFGTQFPHWQLKEPGDLRRVWEEWGQETRCKMARCKALCGISHSVRRERATLPVVP